MSLTVEKCLQAWTNSLRQMNAKADIVFFGDSLMYYGNFASIFPGKVVCNLGLRGDTILGMINRVEQVKLLMPKTACLMGGINDVASCSIDRFEEQYDLLIKLFKEQIPTIELVVFSILPINDVYFSLSCCNHQIKQRNELISLICKKHDVRYVDLYVVYEQDGQLPKEDTVDGIHLKQKAYHKWYSLLLTPHYLKSV
jgi:lysophospholipase L1-like esterase